jgi:hypothetical protein
VLLEKGDGLRLALLGNREVSLLETGYRLTLSIRDDHVDEDGAAGGAKGLAGCVG